MKKIFGGLLVWMFATTVNATVLTFDDIAPTGFVPTAYNGLILNRGGVGQWDFINPTAFSGSQYMVSDGTNNLGQITSYYDTFDFYGAYFHQDDRNPNSTVSIFGLDASDNVLFSDTITATGEWIYHPFNWTNITTFEWTSNPHSNTNIDNFTFTFTSSQVPEPTSLVLLGLGLAGIGYSRRKKTT